MSTYSMEELARLAAENQTMQALAAALPFEERNRAWEEIRRLPPLTMADKEPLVLSISSGENTFSRIRQAFPGRDLRVLQKYILDDYVRPDSAPLLLAEDEARISGNREPPLLRFQTPPENYSPLYQFVDADQFLLTVHGKNLLYQVQKERRLLALTEKSVSLSEESLQKQNLSLELSEKELAIARWTFIAGVCASVFSFLALLLPLVEFIRTL